MGASANKNIERERCFLVTSDAWPKETSIEEHNIRQVYLENQNHVFVRLGSIDGEWQKDLSEITGIENPVIRIRFSDDEIFLTIKGKKTGGRGLEYEYPIEEMAARELCDKFGKYSVEKTRYEILFRSNLWEVDVFHGNLEGLVLAEVELEDDEDEVFIPDWVDREVTEDHRYRNNALAIHGIPSESKLET